MIITTIFKFVNWLKNAFKWIKDVFDLIKWGLAIFAIVSSFGWMKSCSNKNKEISNVTDILTSQIDTFRTKTNLLVTQTETWQLKYKFLEDFTGEIKAENSDLKNELIEANETIKDLKLREKDVQNYIKTELSTRDSLNAPIIWFGEPCKFKLDPIETEFLSLTFKQDDNYNVLGIDHETRNTIYTLVNLYPKRIKNENRKRCGKKHFPNWAVIWGWDHTTYTKVKNPKSKITNVVSIEFDK